MVAIVTVLISLRIIVIDLQSHRIPNLLSLILGLTLLFDLNQVPASDTLLASSIAITTSLVAKVGGGDIKLFIVLLATSGALILTPQYFLGMAVVSLLTTALLGLRDKKLPRDLPFAPALLIPFLASYLAI